MSVVWLSWFTFDLHGKTRSNPGRKRVTRRRAARGHTTQAAASTGQHPAQHCATTRHGRRHNAPLEAEDGTLRVQPANTGTKEPQQCERSGERGSQGARQCSRGRGTTSCRARDATTTEKPVTARRVGSTTRTRRRQVRLRGHRWPVTRYTYEGLGTAPDGLVGRSRRHVLRIRDSCHLCGGDWAWASRRAVKMVALLHCALRSRRHTGHGGAVVSYVTVLVTGPWSHGNIGGRAGRGCWYERVLSCARPDIRRSTCCVRRCGT